MESLGNTLRNITRHSQAWLSLFDECADQFLPDLGGEANARDALAAFCEANPDRADEIYNWLYSRRLESPQERFRRERHQELVVALTGGLSHLEPGIPRWSLEFDDFQIRPEFPTVQQAFKLVQNWVDVEPPGILTLSGSPGVGKSHLAIAAVRQLASLGKAVIYRTEAQLVSEIQESVRTHNGEELIAEYCEVPWLVLDEMFMVGLGEWSSSRLDWIINSRWENESDVRTLVTTNAVASQIPPRIASRLGDVRRASTIVIQARDYRREKTSGG